MKIKTLVAASLLVATSFVQAEWLVSPKVSAEYMDYSTDWLEDSFVAAAGGVTVFNSSGWFVDVEVLSGSGDTVDRDETTLTLGKSLGGGFSVFLGSKDTSTTGFDLDNDYWDFSATGFFGGLSKSIRLANGNSLAFSAAAASLTGDVSLNGIFADEGDAFGTSFGGAWNAAIGQSVTTSFGAKYQSYDYDGLDVESIVSVYGKLAYRF